MAGERIPLKLFVNKKINRVVFAEAEKDFVDVLFSFLTLPLGTVIRLLNNKSPLGCIDNLYESVENLDADHLQTEACKNMLLHPRSEAALLCERDLKVNINDEINPREVYACTNEVCCSKQTCWLSSFKNARCPHCKGKMDSLKTWQTNKNEDDGQKLFVKGGVKYIISEELKVEPYSVKFSLFLFNKMGVTDPNVLEEIQMDLGKEEILMLLKGLVVSKFPLTYLYLNGKDDESSYVYEKMTEQVKTKSEKVTQTKGASIKLFVNKATNKLLFVEARNDFVDQLLSFLTLPLGFMIKILKKNSTIGCVDNLYTSVEKLGLEYIGSEERLNMLLSPKLAPFFSCTNNAFKLDETRPREGYTHGCATCYWKNQNKQHSLGKCGHGVDKAIFKELNAKSPNGGKEKGGGYAKGPESFMLTNDLHVTPLSTNSTICILRKQGLQFNDLVEREIVVGEVQVLNLLQAAMNSETPLTDVFSSQQNQRTQSLVRSVLKGCFQGPSYSFNDYARIDDDSDL